MPDEAHEATELVYVPEPSWMPAMLALGLLGVLAGVFIWWPYGVIGGVIAVVAVVAMFRSSAAGVERLPRRQRLTTAVLPPVPPRKPAE
jgi:hypothetical protein